MNRWKAAAVHLLLSLLLIGGIAFLALHTWFPYQLYRVAAPDKLLYLMWGIDLVAGPLLTLVVYKTGKPSLRFDLSVIAILQVAFLTYGLHTLWASRPVFLVGLPTRFNLVFANEIEPKDLAGARRSEWRTLSIAGPQLVGAEAPNSDKERQDVLFATLATGVDIQQMPHLYVEYSQVAPSLLTASGPVDPTAAAAAGFHIPLRQVALVTSRGNGWMWIDPNTGKPVSTQRADTASTSGRIELGKPSQEKDQQSQPAPNK